MTTFLITGCSTGLGRALAEAAERRANEPRRILPVEHGGPAGPEPTRFGDWEKKGIVSDF